MDSQLNCSLNELLLLDKNLLIERNCELNVIKEFKWDSLHYRDEKEKKKYWCIN